MKKKGLKTLLALLILGLTTSCSGPLGYPGSKGPTGEQGADGATGETGAIGQVGQTGPQGADGQDGENGQDGKSAYELYCLSHPEYEGSEEEFYDDVTQGNLKDELFHTVSFDTGCDYFIDPQIIVHGEKATRPIDPVRENHEFLGWYNDDFKWSFVGLPITEDITLTAKWEEHVYLSGIEITNKAEFESVMEGYVDKIELKYSALYSNGASQSITGADIRVTNSNVARVEGENIVIIRDGSTYITVTYEGYTDSVLLTVEPFLLQVTSVTFVNSIDVLYKGDSFTFKAIDNNGQEKVTYNIVSGEGATLDGATLTAISDVTTEVIIEAVSIMNNEICACHAVTILPEVTSVTINNKEELLQDWYSGDSDRDVNYTIELFDGTTKARGATVSSSNPDVISCPGGIKIHANNGGSAIITVTFRNFSDSIELIVLERPIEETVTVAELLNKPVNDATAYIVTGYIVGWQSGKTDATSYGNFIIADNPDDAVEAGILVYGATLYEESLKYDETLKTWSWSNPYADRENPRPFPFADYKIGDQVTMKGLRLDYNTTKEFNGIILEHIPVQKEPVTEVTFKTKTTSIGNSYSFTFKALDNNDEELVTYSLTGDAATLNGATVTADPTKTGYVTLTATSTEDNTIKASIEIEIVQNPEIVEATLEEAINDEGIKGNKLFKVTAKTVANASTKDGDQYGNFDYTDGTNTITSYGLSANASSMSYYGDIWNFKNDKTFQNTGVEIGSDNEYTVIVMRSDYKGTKQLVGYIYTEPVTPEEPDEPSGSDTPDDGSIISKTISIADYAATNSWENSIRYDTIIVDENISVTANGTNTYGVNTGKYYTNGQNWRIYQTENPEVTFTAAEGYEIVSITIEYTIRNTGTLTFGGENIASGTLVTINASTAIFGAGNTGDATNGIVHITSFTVIYKQL